MMGMERFGGTLSLRANCGLTPFPNSCHNARDRNFSSSKWRIMVSSTPRRFPLCSARKSKSDDEKNTEAAEELSGFPLIKFHRKDSVSIQPLSKDTAMGLVLKAAGSKGWTTGSGMEGPAVSSGPSENTEIADKSIYPWSLFTKSPRRRMRVAFTCGVCGQRTTRAINPHAYTDGTVFVQCAGCDVFHKLVDNLNLFHELEGSIYPRYVDTNSKKPPPFKFLDMDDFPLF